MKISYHTFLFTVSDRISIEGSGVVLFPGIPVDGSAPNCRRGDALILRTPLGDTIHTSLKDIEMIRCDRSYRESGTLISLPKEANKFDLPVGTEVYLAAFP